MPRYYSRKLRPRWIEQYEEHQRRARPLPGRLVRVLADEVRPGDILAEERGYEDVVTSVDREHWGWFQGKKLGKVTICQRPVRRPPDWPRWRRKGRERVSCRTYEMSERLPVRRPPRR